MIRIDAVTQATELAEGTKARPVLIMKLPFAEPLNHTHTIIIIDKRVTIFGHLYRHSNSVFYDISIQL